MVLENDMVEKWRSVYKKSDELNSDLSQVLDDNHADVGQFLKSKEIQEQYLETVFPTW